ncbi:hypothetical protein [Vibrio algivorus]|uniref:hypothetical protein n=1 Tax=Vibrio algivorus TaxID=1667024 RepID=UPI001FD3ED11|nr:hypothetical protein [Vibrio algivorus]
MTTLNDSVYGYGLVGEQLLTYTGSVVGALSLSGIEPTILSFNDRVHVTALIRNVFQRLPAPITLTQYYVHHDNHQIDLGTSSNPRVNLLLKRRAHFLNTHRNLNKSELFWVIELPKAQHGHWSRDLLQRLFNAVFDNDAKQTLKTELSHRHHVLVEYKELKRQLEQLKQVLDDIKLRTSFLSADNHTLRPGGLFGLTKTLSRLNPDYLYQDTPPQPERWDRIIPSGQVSSVMIEGTHYLKIDGETPRYARIASVTGVGEQFMPEAAFCSSQPSPVCEEGNYIFTTRFTPLTRAQRSRLLKSKEQALYREQMKITDFISGESGASQIAQRMQSSPKMAGLLDELSRAQNGEDKLGTFSATIVLFNTDIHQLNEQVLRLSRVLEEAQFHLIWESIGLLDAYQSIQIGYPKSTLRQFEVNTTQAAALSLLYRGSEGIPKWQHGNQWVDSLYVLESDDGLPFHYTPFVGDKCLVIGVGPTRSGKTFLKNCIATHFQKLDGMYYALDIDPGSEPIAPFFSSLIRPPQKGLTLLPWQSMSMMMRLKPIF